MDDVSLAERGARPRSAGRKNPIGGRVNGDTRQCLSELATRQDQGERRAQYKTETVLVQNQRSKSAPRL